MRYNRYQQPDHILVNMANVIVIAAHPDDETLGAGGTLLKHKKNGDTIHWLIVTNISESNGFSAEIVTRRQREIEEVALLFDFNGVHRLNYPTMSLSSRDISTLVKDISNVFNDVKPEIIYTINRSDIHSDHRVIFQAVVACTKSFRYPFIKKLLMYECLSETEFAAPLHENVFIPNYYVDVSEFMERKLQIMEVFKSEMAPHPFPRSGDNIFALATFRGASVGVKYAEAFQLLKYIDK